jgi:orotate phosphoribosyltransferase
MPNPPLASVPSRDGHFRLESGYHANVWLTLDALFVEPSRAAPLASALAARLRKYEVSGICGPFVGGAFLAQLLATELRVKFFYAERVPTTSEPGLFTAQYRLTPELERLVRGERLAIVDDVISAGSSVRATIASASAADASIAVVGTLVVLGDTAIGHFDNERIPIEALERKPFSMWTPTECPLCSAGIPLETL